MDLDRLGHQGHGRVGPGDHVEVGAPGDLRRAVVETDDLQPRPPRPKLVGKHQPATRPDAEALGHEHGERDDRRDQRQRREHASPQRRRVEHLGEPHRGDPLGGLARRSREHLGVEALGLRRMPGQRDGGQQAVVELRKTPLQQHRHVGVAQPGEDAADDEVEHKTAEPQHGDNEPQQPELDRRLEEPVDHQAHPERRPQPRHRRRQPVRQTYARIRRRSASSVVRTAGLEVRVVQANRGAWSCHASFARSPYQPFHAQQAADEVHHPGEPGLLPETIGRGGQDDRLGPVGQLVDERFGRVGAERRVEPDVILPPGAPASLPNRASLRSGFSRSRSGMFTWMRRVRRCSSLSGSAAPGDTRPPRWR